MVLSSALASLDQTRLAISRFARPSAFSLPSNAPAAASRLARNLTAFRAHYALLLWLSLLAFLLPTHRKTMLFLMLISKVILSYAVLRRIFPGSDLLRRVLDERIVAGIFVFVVGLQIWLAGAVVRLCLAGFAVGPIVVAHAVFRSGDGLGGENGKVGVEIGGKKNGDLESGAGQGSDRSA